MSIHTEKRSKWDTPLWLGVSLLLIAGLVANHHYQEMAWGLRATAWLLLTCLLLLMASQTSHGRGFYGFLLQARAELRKVVWPSWNETMRTTALVAAAVVITAIFLWGLDALLMWAFSWFTGQRG